MAQEPEPLHEEAKARQQREENEQIVNQLRQSQNDCAILMRWPNTILAILLSGFVAYGLVVDHARFWSLAGLIIAASLEI